MRRPRVGLNPITAYFRGRLHRRIFGFFGLAILLTGATVAMVMSLLRDGPSYQTEAARLKAFVSARFGAVWDDPQARDDLARSMATELDVDVVVLDDHAATITSYGARCDPPNLVLPVARGGKDVGAVGLCMTRHGPHGPIWQLPISLVVACAVLWAISGKVARRLSRPIAELARVAEEIGGGKFSARAPITCHQPGEVGALFYVVNNMASRIERQMADQRELLAAVSHEIRTPLARIRLLVEIARESGATSGTFDELDCEVIEIDRLVGELLASSRLDFAALTPTSLDVRETAARALDRAGLSEELLDDEGVKTSFEADATLIARALANLLDNAKNHGGGVVALRVRVSDASVRFEVDDGGAGFEPGDETKAFASFYRRPASNGKDKGSLGLGLALVKRIALAHGGSAFAENRREGGARVGIEIPLSGGVAKELRST
jgi:signal transduction histidine kinase